MNTTQTQVSPVVQPCDECGFEDELTHVTPVGELPTDVCRFCRTNFPVQYCN